MIQRMITGIVLIGVGLFIIWEGGLYLQVWMGLVGLVIAYECIKMGKSRNLSAFPWLIYPLVILSIASVTCSYFDLLWNSVYWQIFTLIILASFLFELLSPRLFWVSSPLSYSARIILLICFTLPYVSLLRNTENGLLYTSICFLVIWSTDIMALFGGKKFGKHALSKLSPQKTIEGTLIGIGSSVAVICLWASQSDRPVLNWAVLALAISAVAQLGDLHESRVKRFFKIKDSGQLLPGHGGFYDRADSTLFVFPIFYIFTKVLL